MTVTSISDVEFGDELEPFTPDNSLASTGAFAAAVGYDGNVYTLNPAEQILYGFNPRACAP